MNFLQTSGWVGLLLFGLVLIGVLVLGIEVVEWTQGVKQTVAGT